MGLRRSLIFWAGVLVMGFLAWAWRDSLHYESFYMRGGYVAASSWGGVAVLRDQSLPSDYGRVRGRRIHPLYLLQRPFFLRGQGKTGSQEDAGKSPYLDVRQRRDLQNQPPGVWILYLPYWLLLGVVGLAWMGMMIWRARRWKRARAVGSTMDAVG